MIPPGSAKEATEDAVFELIARQYAERFGTERLTDERVTAQLRASAEAVTLVLAVAFDPSDVPPITVDG